MLRSRRWGYAAAAWALLFAALHFFWALGGSTGLTTSAGRELAENRPGWFVAGGLWGVGSLLVVAAGLGLALARARPSGWRRRAVILAGAAVALLLVSRGIGVAMLLLGGALDGNVAVDPAQRHWTLLLWNPWFVVGGVAFGLATLAGHVHGGMPTVGRCSSVRRPARTGR
jgi:hypothetical protein